MNFSSRIGLLMQARLILNDTFSNWRQKEFTKTFSLLQCNCVAPLNAQTLIRKRSSSVKTQKEKTISFWHQHWVLLCLKRKCKGNTIAASLIKPKLFWMIEKTPGLHTKRLAARINLLPSVNLSHILFMIFAASSKPPYSAS